MGTLWWNEIYSEHGSKHHPIYGHSHRHLVKICYLNYYFWSTEPQRESDSEGQVEEGVRVALLKLVTDGSRPKGEISDS